MKIKEIEIYQLGEQSTGCATWAANSIQLKLTTSDGVVGYGEAVPTLRVQPVIQSLREVARVYLDKVIITPYIRVVASTFHFALTKNLKYLAITVFVLVVLTANLIFH